MKLLHFITLATLFITFTSAQDVDKVPEVVDAHEDHKSGANISFSVGSNTEDFGFVKHDGEDLVRVIKTVNGHLTTEYFTVVDVDVQSNSEDGQHDEEASAIDEEASAVDEEFFENYFANLENLD